MICHLFCSLRVPSSSLTRVIFFFCNFKVKSKGVGVRILFKKGHFSAAFLSHETTLFQCKISNYICSRKGKYRRVPELSKKLSFVHFYLLKEYKNLNYSKFPRSILMKFSQDVVLMYSKVTHVS